MQHTESLPDARMAEAPPSSGHNQRHRDHRGNHRLDRQEGYLGRNNRGRVTFAARCKCFLFSLCVVPVLALIYWVVNSEGARRAIVILAMKLYRVPVPGFSYLQHYKNLRDLDLAHVFVLVLLFAVWMLSTKVLEVHLFGVPHDIRLNTGAYLRFLYSVSAVVLFSDIILFYRGLVDQGGLLITAGGLTPVVGTAAYAGLLAFVAYVHVMLKHPVQ